MKIITAIARAFQLLFAIVVLGLSVSLAKGQRYGSVPAATGYAAFTGGLGIVAALVGCAAFFIDALDGIVTWALDGLASLALLAGGITFAILLRSTSCSNKYTTWDNVILSGGCVTVDKNKMCMSNPSRLESRCTSAKADTAFMFIDFVVCIAVIACTFFSSRNRSSSKTSVV